MGYFDNYYNTHSAETLRLCGYDWNRIPGGHELK
jgi:hypothetical protein